MRARVALSLTSSAALTALVGGCTAQQLTDKADEYTLEVRPGLVAASTVDHGPIEAGVPELDELEPHALVHHWHFDIAASSEIRLRTHPAGGTSPAVDTVLYLFDEAALSAGGRPIARNDDRDGDVFSEVTLTIPSGRYVALVKGFSLDDAGRFGVALDCGGPGCNESTRARFIGEAKHRYEIGGRAELVPIPRTSLPESAREHYDRERNRPDVTEVPGAYRLPLGPSFPDVYAVEVHDDERLVIDLFDEDGALASGDTIDGRGVRWR